MIDGLKCDCHLGERPDGTPCPKCTFGAIRVKQAERDQYLLAGHGDAIDPSVVAQVIPARYRDNEGKTLANLFQGEPAKVKALVDIEKWTRQSWPEQKRRSMFLHGPVGTGKTTLAMYALKRFMEYGHRSRAVFWTLWLTQAESLDYQYSQAEVVELTKVPVLLLDDLGSQDRTEGKFRKLAPETNKRQDIARTIIDARMNKMVPTIITTNLTVDQFGVMWGERVASRIREDFTIVEVNGVDLREKYGVNA